MDTNSKIADKFCKENRFAPLAKYFQGMELNDLAWFTQDDLYRHIPDDDKLLMHVFISRFLLSYINLPDPFAVPGLFKFENGHLDLSKKVRNISYLEWESGCLSVDKLKTVFTATLPLEEVTSVDLSENILSKEDMHHIFDLISALPNCHTVDLSRNSIAYLEEEIDNDVKKILELDHVRYVIISSNRLASLEGAVFLRSLNDKSLCKLIFIAQQWLECGRWKYIIKDETKQKIVYETHLQYFERT